MRLLEFVTSLSLCQHLLTLNKMTGFQDLTGFDKVLQSKIHGVVQTFFDFTCININTHHNACICTRMTKVVESFRVAGEIQKIIIPKCLPLGIFG